MKIEAPQSDNGLLTITPLTVLQRVAIQSLVDCPDYIQLCDILKSFKTWVWDRGDLICWAPVFNLFDEILEEYIVASGLLTVPGNSADSYSRLLPPSSAPSLASASHKPGLTTELVEEVLRVTHLILESCAAKPMYNSFDRIVVLLDSLNERVLKCAIPVAMMHAFAARKARKVADAAPLSEIQSRLAILANSPSSSVEDVILKDPVNSSQSSASDYPGAASSVTPSSIRNNEKHGSAAAGSADETFNFSKLSIKMNPLIFYNDSSWQPTPESRITLAATNNENEESASCSFSNSQLLRILGHPASVSFASTSNMGTPSQLQLERARNLKLYEIVQQHGIPASQVRHLRHRARVLLSAVHSLAARRDLVDIELFSLMSLLTISPTNLQVHIAINYHLLLEAAYLLRCHRHISYHTLVIVIDFWVTMLHERVQFRSVLAHLELSAPHGLLADLLRFYLGCKSLYPPGTQDQPLPELLAETDRVAGMKEDFSDVPNPPSRATDVVADSSAESGQTQKTVVRSAVASSSPVQPKTDIVVKDEPEVEELIADSYVKFKKFRDAENNIERTQTLMDCDRQAHNHCEVVTAILDLYHEAYQNSIHPGLTALTHPSLVAAVLAVLEIRDYRYLQAQVSAMRLVEAFYVSPTASLRTSLRELQAVSRAGARTRYETAKLFSLLKTALKYGIDVEGALKPQSDYGEEAVVQQHMKRFQVGHGVPTVWTNCEKSAFDCFFWQVFEEVANRKCLLVSLLKEGPFSENWVSQVGVEQPGNLGDSFINQYGLVLRLIFRHPEYFGYPVYASAVQLLHDLISEEPSVEEQLVLKDVIPEFFLSMTDQVLKSESSLNVIPSAVSVSFLHSSAVEVAKQLNYQPLISLITVVNSPVLVHFDRVSGITSLIGSTLEEIVRNQNDIQQKIADAIISLLDSTLEECRQMKGWKVKNSQMIFRLIHKELNSHKLCTTDDLILPKSTNERYFSDRLSNLSRCIHSFAQPSGSPLRILIHQGILYRLFKLCGVSLRPFRDVPSLPPYFLHVSLTHPANSLLRQIVTSAISLSPMVALGREERFGGAEDEGLGYLPRLCFQAARRVLYLISVIERSAAKLKRWMGLTSDVDGTYDWETTDGSVLTPQEKEHIMELRRELLESLSALGSCLHVIIGVNRDVSLFTSIGGLSAKSTYANILMSALAGLTPILTPIFDYILRRLYDQAELLTSGDCPILLGLRSSLHEHPNVRANKLFVRRHQHQPALNSICFRLPGVDPICAGINRVNISSNFFLWTSLSAYCFSAGNQALEKGVQDENDLIFEETDASGTGDMADENAQDSDMFPWDSSRVLKESMRILCLCLRSYLASCARAANSNTSNNRRGRSAQAEFSVTQKLLAFQVGAGANRLLSGLPDWPNPKVTTSPKVSSSCSVPPSGYIAKWKGASFDARHEHCLRLIGTSRRIAEVLDILYRLHVDDRTQGSLLAVTVDVFWKLGGFLRVFKAVRLVLNLQHSLAMEIVRRIEADPTFDKKWLPEEARSRINNIAKKRTLVPLREYLQFAKVDEEWKQWQYHLTEILVATLSDEELSVSVLILDKCVQSCLSYCEKITSWKRMFNSTSASHLQRTSRRPGEQTYANVAAAQPSQSQSPSPQSPRDNETQNMADEPNAAAPPESPQAVSSEEQSSAAPVGESPIAVQTRGDEMLSVMSVFCGTRLLETIQWHVGNDLLGWWLLMADENMDCSINSETDLVEQLSRRLCHRDVSCLFLCARAVSSLFRTLHHLVDSQAPARKHHAAGWLDVHAHYGTSPPTGVADSIIASALGFLPNRTEAENRDSTLILEAALTEMGFEAQRVRRAVRNTRGEGIEAATEWLIAHPPDGSEEEAAEGDASEDNSQSRIEDGTSGEFPTESQAPPMAERESEAATNSISKLIDEYRLARHASVASVTDIANTRFRGIMLKSLSLCAVSLVSDRDVGGFEYLNEVLVVLDQLLNEANIKQELDEDNRCFNTDGAEAMMEIRHTDLRIERRGSITEIHQILMAGQEPTIYPQAVAEYVESQAVVDLVGVLKEHIVETSISAASRLSSRLPAVGDAFLKIVTLPVPVTSPSNVSNPTAEQVIESNIDAAVSAVFSRLLHLLGPLEILSASKSLVLQVPSQQRDELVNSRAVGKALSRDSLIRADQIDFLARVELEAMDLENVFEINQIRAAAFIHDELMGCASLLFQLFCNHGKQSKNAAIRALEAQKIQESEVKDLRTVKGSEMKDSEMRDSEMRDSDAQAEEARNIHITRDAEERNSHSKRFATPLHLFLHLLRFFTETQNTVLSPQMKGIVKHRQPDHDLLLPIPLWAAMNEPMNIYQCQLVDDEQQPALPAGDRFRRRVPDGRYGVSGGTAAAPLSARPPKWTTALLLCMVELLPIYESLLPTSGLGGETGNLHQDPTTAETRAEDEAIVSRWFLSEEVQKQTVVTCLDLISSFPGLDSNLSLAIFQLITPLTVHHKNAVALLQYHGCDGNAETETWVGGGLGLLLRLPRTAQFPGSLKAISTLCCNLLEDAGILAIILKQTITTVFKKKGIAVAKVRKGAPAAEEISTVAKDPPSVMSLPAASTMAASPPGNESVSYVLPLEELLADCYTVARRSPALFESLLCLMCVERQEVLSEEVVSRVRKGSETETETAAAMASSPKEDKAGAPSDGEKSVTLQDVQQWLKLTEEKTAKKVIFLQLLDSDQMEANLEETPAGRKMKKLLSCGGRPPVAAWVTMSAIAVHLQAFSHVLAISRWVPWTSLQNAIDAAATAKAGGASSERVPLSLPPAPLPRLFKPEAPQISEFLNRLPCVPGCTGCSSSPPAQSADPSHCDFYTKPNALFPFAFSPNSLLYILHVLLVAFPGLLPYLARVPPTSLVETFQESLRIEPRSTATDETLSPRQFSREAPSPGDEEGPHLLTNILSASPPWAFGSFLAQQHQSNQSAPIPLFRYMWRKVLRIFLTTSLPVYSDCRRPGANCQGTRVVTSNVITAPKELHHLAPSAQNPSLSPAVAMLLRLAAFFSTAALGNIDIRRRLIVEVMMQAKHLATSKLTMTRPTKMAISSGNLAPAHREGKRSTLHGGLVAKQEGKTMRYDAFVLAIFFISNIALRLVQLPAPVIPSESKAKLTLVHGQSLAVAGASFSKQDLHTLRLNYIKILGRLDLNRDDSVTVSHMIVKCLELLCRPPFVEMSAPLPSPIVTVTTADQTKETLSAALPRLLSGEETIPERSVEASAGAQREASSSSSDDLSSASSSSGEDDYLNEFLMDEFDEMWERWAEDASEDNEFDFGDEGDEEETGRIIFGEHGHRHEGDQEGDDDDEEDEEDGDAEDADVDILNPPALPHEAEEEEEPSIQLPTGDTALTNRLEEGLGPEEDHHGSLSADMGVDGLEVIEEEYDEDEAEVPRVRDDDEDEFFEDGVPGPAEEGGLLQDGPDQDVEADGSAALSPHPPDGPPTDQNEGALVFDDNWGAPLELSDIINHLGGGGEPSGSQAVAGVSGEESDGDEDDENRGEEDEEEDEDLEEDEEEEILLHRRSIFLGNGDHDDMGNQPAGGTFGSLEEDGGHPTNRRRLWHPHRNAPLILNEGAVGGDGSSLHVNLFGVDDMLTEPTEMGAPSGGIRVPPRAAFRGSAIVGGDSAIGLDFDTRPPPSLDAFPDLLTAASSGVVIAPAPVDSTNRFGRGVLSRSTRDQPRHQSESGWTSGRDLQLPFQHPFVRTWATTPVSDPPNLNLAAAASVSGVPARQPTAAQAPSSQIVLIPENSWTVSSEFTMLRHPLFNTNETAANSSAFIRYWNPWTARALEDEAVVRIPTAANRALETQVPLVTERAVAWQRTRALVGSHTVTSVNPFAARLLQEGYHPVLGSTAPVEAPASEIATSVTETTAPMAETTTTEAAGPMAESTAQATSETAQTTSETAHVMPETATPVSDEATLVDVAARHDVAHKAAACLNELLRRGLMRKLRKGGLRTITVDVDLQDTLGLREPVLRRQGAPVHDPSRSVSAHPEAAARESDEAMPATELAVSQRDETAAPQGEQVQEHPEGTQPSAAAPSSSESSSDSEEDEEEEETAEDMAEGETEPTGDITERDTETAHREPETADDSNAAGEGRGQVEAQTQEEPVGLNGMNLQQIYELFEFMEERQFAESQRPVDPSYGISGLWPLSLCLGVTRRQMLDICSIDSEFLEALPLNYRQEAIVLQLSLLPEERLREIQTQNRRLFEARSAQQQEADTALQEASLETRGDTNGSQQHTQQETETETERTDLVQAPPPASQPDTVSSGRPRNLPTLNSIPRMLFESLPPAVRHQVLSVLAPPETSPSPAERAVDMDNASFLATLDPALRREVLLTATDEFLDTLPPAFYAEAQEVRGRPSLLAPPRDRLARRSGGWGRRREGPRGGGGDGDGPPSLPLHFARGAPAEITFILDQPSPLAGDIGAASRVPSAPPSARQIRNAGTAGDTAGNSSNFFSLFSQLVSVAQMSSPPGSVPTLVFSARPSAGGDAGAEAASDVRSFVLDLSSVLNSLDDQGQQRRTPGARRGGRARREARREGGGVPPENLTFFNLASPHGTSPLRAALLSFAAGSNRDATTNRNSNALAAGVQAAVVFNIPVSQISNTPRKEEGTVPVLLPLALTVEPLDWTSTTTSASEPPVDPQGIHLLCRLFFFSKQINRRDLHRTLFGLTMAHEKCRNSLLQTFLLILWDTAQDQHTSLMPARSAPAQAVDFPPSHLYQISTQSVSPDCATWAVTNQTSKPIVSYRVLEHLRSLFSVNPNIGEFFCQPVAHPSQFNPTAWEGAKSSVNPETETPLASAPGSLEAPSTLDPDAEEAILLNEVRRKRGRAEVPKSTSLPSSASGPSVSRNQRPRSKKDAAAGVGPVYSINTLIKMLSSSFFQTKPNHLAHLYLAISFLVLGPNSMEPEGPSSDRRVPRSVPRATDESRPTAEAAVPYFDSTDVMDVPIPSPVRRRNAPPSPPSAEAANFSPAPANEAAGPTSTTSTDVATAPTVHDRIVDVISEEAGEVLIRTFVWGPDGRGLIKFEGATASSSGLDKEESSLWLAIQGSGVASSSFTSNLINGHIATAKMIGKLIEHPKHSTWAYRLLKTNVISLFDKVTELLSLTSQSLGFASDITFSSPSKSKPPTPTRHTSSLESSTSLLSFKTDLLLSLMPRVTGGIQAVFRQPNKLCVKPLPDQLRNQKNRRPPESGGFETELASAHSKPTTSPPQPVLDCALTRVANFFKDISGASAIWETLDQTLRDIAQAFPQLAYVPATDETISGDELTAETETGRGRSNRRRRRRTGLSSRGATLPPESQSVHTFGVASPLPVVLNRLVPLVESYMYLEFISVAAELQCYSVHPAFLASPGSVAYSRAPTTPGVWRTAKGKQISLNVFRTIALNDLYGELRKQLGDPEIPLSPSHDRFIAFCEIHQKPLNGLMRQQPQLLLSNFNPMIHLAPMHVWFDNKRHFFRQRIRQMREGQRFDPIRLIVRRSHVFVDSYHQLRGKELRGRLIVNFQSEEGVDGGGLTREWYSILSREMFNPDYALFRREGSKSEFNHPNPLSSVNPDHLHFFKFIGMVIGKALYDGQYLDCYFTRPFYKLMLGRKIAPQDAESVDPEFYRNLQAILEHPVDSLGLDLTFTTDVDEFGKTTVVELKPGGASIPVTDENKHEYVKMMCDHKILHGLNQQLEAFFEGFNELMPAELLSIFDDKEIELLISGLPQIDLSDLKAHTEYRGYLPDDQHIKWFWEILEEMEQNQLATFLQFATGTSRVPLGGFQNLMGMRGPQRFVIVKAYGRDRLPAAHTCFNQLDLPDYETRDQMKQKLLLAITEGKEGFGFA
eukprot:Gregarina_sp_Poly_1__3457@NODE_1_length_32023_cov_193_025347_g0_i0_p1_GENE_NODE_1_length_32023_cov_193_025347_g0_i0NODE_1_length_32023_cov_193_025347_g0_i0_p1_ORF_typecomplete_len5828_score1014_55HECT/PF00632_25/2_6e107DUF913/PF06025_12/3_4e26DUF908/PF06012_12/5_3e26UBA/PF00627_31/1_9e06UBA/PF00627_31/1_3e04UBM/PF14377_6/1_4e04UBM/PF14377_6/0_86UBM/PF14377_6/21UBM/PF14377_6/1_5e05UBM/PF14377_6/3e02UBM/PF14377_6/4_6e03DUF3525/PF12039_8/0_24_NODE_1_length_32023_cov_193_025347_g0_i08217565